METETAIDSEYTNGNGHTREAEPEPELGRLPALIESLLFAAGAPVPMSRLVEALDGPERREISAALKALADGYEREGRGVRLVQVAGGYQLRTPHEHAPWVRRLLRERPPRLSRPMLETVAIVAYRQPCTRIDIEAIRGVECDAVLSTLLERRLVRVVGRKDAPGRPLLYGTTREFLEIFGLPDLASLPTLRELGEAEILGAAELVVDGAGVRPPGANGEADTPPPAEPASEPAGDGG
jgi:segregation and condensation protein B